ncbi:hypothetical protein CBQ28_13660 [Pseudoalteromonas sp. GCY]|uniref:Uncharacterized protein n=1 Tax=Pseudoalteromonas piscicida TaxID=43662 RepID=A0AAQ2EVX0_PSEO7|nr:MULTISPECIES: hypothetical protein [Pseudoalteromonas]PHI36471.1 hypothetical protein CBQ28_13660 [Pseudoalteromonas sp. GCY]QQQ67785.1 hypothetical protein JJQ94_08215 [Pseudoalteromonas sp. GCY]TMN40182.1 hypothetical protein CWB95_11350 [Pseudoalteromonas piscicida]TMN44194.1 hypothetical protein CWB94_02265 [Pseudoalteromonas piscicida]TMN50177.1 hypothetical protein CWB92_13765 [Pseudoalteromonas piscicida]
MQKVIKFFGKVYKAVGVGDFLYRSMYKDKAEANKTYKKLQPTLKIVFGQSGRSSKEFKALLNMIAALAPVGAVRRNFIRYYVENEEAWRRLPKDPDEIPYGYWW